MNLSAMDDNGNPVDWWFIYKVAGKSKTSDGKKVKGTEYVYFDSNMSDDANAKPTLSRNHVDDQKGALAYTLQQIYTEQGASTQHTGWICYNDEDPITEKTNGSRGHTKGVLAFDIASDTGFWLIQSTPKFPPEESYSFPKTGMPNAQTFLCITLKDADTAQSIAKQMFSAQQPNVYLHSEIPVDLENDVNDPRVKLMQDQVVEGNTPIDCSIPFYSKGGVKFIAMAKNKYWQHDFYNDLVGPTLHDDLDVETWEHGRTPPSLDSDKIHTVVDMEGIDLSPLGIDIEWPEPDDHAKLAISARSEQVHYVCVGDINFTLTMRTRSGGTVAFQCEPLWSSLSAVLVGVKTHLKDGSKAAHLQKRATAAKHKRSKVHAKV